MVRYAESDEKKAQRASRAKAELQEEAVSAYLRELDKKAAGLESLGAQAICNRYMELYHARTGKSIKLNHATIINHANGKRTRAQCNTETKAWLKPAEVKVVIAYIIEVGNQGFPLSHRRLKEHVDEILRERLGAEFPETGVGKKWTQRFLTKHSDEIRMAWASPLDEKRGRAVNPHTNEAYFTLLHDTIENNDIEEENSYATDEIGIIDTSGTRERVMGARRKGPQYQQSGSTRENTTVIVTICADGTTTSPAVIFKGSGYCTNWSADKNPAEASVGYSKKGWTNGEIGVEWIKDFDRQTKAKAKGKARLLLVDGHNSHYTRGFLRYARMHNIHVLCYPAHATHVYQGLDVVVFSVLKRFFREERDAHRRKTGESFSKSNFLLIYGKAHLRALTPSTIKSAFRKTGVWPYDPSVITAAMMAPSKDTSLAASLPVIPPTPVRAVAKLLTHALHIKQDLFDNDDDDATGLPDVEDLEDDPFVDRLETVREELEPADDSIGDGEGASGDADRSGAADGPCTSSSSAKDGMFGMEAAIKEAVEMLQKSSLSLCMKSSSAPLELKVNAHIPMSSTDADTLAITPKTANEIRLLAALRESEADRLYLRQRTVELQAANILNEVYCKSLRERLAFQDEKKRKGKGKGKLVGDGLPVLLTSDEFYERVVEFEQAQLRKEREKDERAANKESLQKELEEWKVLVEKREESIKERRLAWAKEKEDYAAAKAKWASDKKAGKVKGKFTMPTPKLGPLPPVIPKPKLQASIVDDEADLDVADGDEGQRGNDDSDDSE